MDGLEIKIISNNLNIFEFDSGQKPVGLIATVEFRKTPNVHDGFQMKK